MGVPPTGTRWRCSSSISAGSTTRACCASTGASRTCCRSCNSSASCPPALRHRPRLPSARARAGRDEGSDISRPWPGGCTSPRKLSTPTACTRSPSWAYRTGSRPPWYITRSSDVSAASATGTIGRTQSVFLETWGFVMATYIVVHEVNNVDHWLHSPKRQEIIGPMGITGQLLHRYREVQPRGADPGNTRHGSLPGAPAVQAGADAMKFDGVRPETIVIFEKASGHV